MCCGHLGNPPPPRLSTLFVHSPKGGKLHLHVLQRRSNKKGSPEIFYRKFVFNLPSFPLVSCISNLAVAIVLNKLSNVTKGPSKHFGGGSFEQNSVASGGIGNTPPGNLCSPGIHLNVG